MISLLFIIALGGWLILAKRTSSSDINDLPAKLSEKLSKLWDIAQQSIADGKTLRAEKALLTILKVDERNATAYNRLGILYAQQKEFDDAVECFEIAQSLEPSASSLHNVGLIHYETQKFDKAALAFEQAIEMDNTHASRYVAYAKVLEKLNNQKGAIQALEQSLKIDPTTQTMRILADAYERNGQEQEALLMKKRAEKAAGAQNAQQSIRQPRKVVM